jgi:replicative DNA helicase
MRKLITKSLSEGTDEYLVKLPKQLLDDKELECIEWIAEYKNDNKVLPTAERLKREDAFSYFIETQTSFDPLNDLYTQAVEKLNKREIRSINSDAIDDYENGVPEPEILQRIKDRMKYLIQSKTKRAKSILKEERDYVYNSSESTYMPIGIPNVDKASGGLSVGDYALMFAPTGTGKTTVLCFIAVRAALAGHEVLLISREESRDRLQNKVDAIFGGFNDELFKKLTLEDAEELKTHRDKIDSSSKQILDIGGDIEIPEGAAYTPANIAEMIRTKYEETGRTYDLVLVDGIYHMCPNGAPPGSVAGNDWRLFRQLSTQLMDITMNQDRPELAVRMLVTSQARPGTSSGGALTDNDIGYSKGISQDNELVFSIRETPDEIVKEYQKLLMVEIQKNRKGVRAGATNGTRLLIDFSDSTLKTGDFNFDEDLTKQPLKIRGK